MLRFVWSLQADTCSCALGTKSRTAAAAEAVKAEVQKQQKDLSRSIAPMVQNIMTPGYDMGFAEAGTGSHRRRVAIVEGHLSKQSKTIFAKSISPILEALVPLRTKLRQLLSERCATSICAEATASYSILWEDTTAQQRELRAKMLPKLEMAVGEAQTALSRLLRSQGCSDQDAAVAAGFNGNDAAEAQCDVMDVTDEMERAQRAAIPVVELE